MQNVKCLVQMSRGLFIAALATVLVAGCHSAKSQDGDKAANATTTAVPAVAAPAAAEAAPAAPAPAEATPAPAAAVPAEAAPATAAPATEAAAAAPAAAGSAIRIKAGATAAYTDSNTNVWLPDQGFVDGDVIERDSNLEIANTQDQALYRSERYGMSSFSWKLPNGKYIVKLHFAETYEDITGPGQRVFSFNVAGQEFKDFDVFAKAGGAKRAYIETVNVEVADGKLDITFTTNIQSPEINGIEIIPAP